MSTDVTNPPALPPTDPAAAKPMSIPWWTRGDTNAFFGLGFNILVNVLTLTGLMIGVIQVPAGDVLGTVLPALGVALILGNLYYTFLARRLAKKENRTDVTALPYGPSVPHMFIVIFVVMLPVYLNTNDAMQAWQAGLAWAFMIGIIVMIGAFVGPYIRKLTPRAAMLGTLAGISITFISMRPAAQMWEVAWIGLPVMAIILIGFFTDMKLPFGIPVGLAALLVGTAIGWIGGFMSAPDVGQAVSDIAVGIPDLRLDMLFSGLSNLAPLLGTAIPLGVYNFTEAMSNVESAAAAGDNYNLRSVLLADGDATGQPQVGEEPDQDDAEDGQADPGRLPDLAGRSHRDEAERDPSQGAEQGGARGDLADERSDEGADQDDDPDDEGPGQAGGPRPQRITGGQVDRQHDHEDHDEHVRHAGPVRHRGHVGPSLASGEAASEQGVVDIPDDQGDAQRRQHRAEHLPGRQVHDEDQQRGQGEDVHQDVERQSEEGVEVAPGPPRNLEAIGGIGSGQYGREIHDRLLGLRPWRRRVGEVW